MPILKDIRDHKVLGREYRRGLEAGRAEARAENIHEGVPNILRRLMEARFGPLTPQIEKALENKCTTELLDLSVRLLAAKSIKELLPPLSPADL